MWFNAWCREEVEPAAKGTGKNQGLARLAGCQQGHAGSRRQGCLTLPGGGKHPCLP